MPWVYRPWDNSVAPVEEDSQTYNPWASDPSIGLRIGPLTRTDEERMKAKKAWENKTKNFRDPQWDATKRALTDVYDSARNWAYRNLTTKGAMEERSADAQFRWDEGRGIRPMPGTPPASPSPTSPEMIVGGVRQAPNEPVSVPQWVRDMHDYVSGVGHVAKDTLPDLIPSMTSGMYGRNAVGAATKAGELTGGGGGTTVATPSDPSTSTTVPAEVPGKTSPVPSVEPGAATPQTPQGQEVGPLGFDDWLGVIQAAYPDYKEDTSRQEKADAFAAQEGERTRLLAQLAFAAGLTKAGGKRFEGIGEGFAGAAVAYGSGFRRYQQALQDSADRFSDTEQGKQRVDLAKRDAALKLYTSATADARDRAEKQQEKQLGYINEQFKMLFQANKGDLGIVDPEAQNKIVEAWTRSLQEGRFIMPELDVSDE